MATRKTSVEINEELLESVRRILEIVRREARRVEVGILRTMRGLDLDDPEIMAGAWRK